MDMDVAAVFLAGSILTVMGFLVILAGVIIANNMIHRAIMNLQDFLPRKKSSNKQQPLKRKSHEKPVKECYAISKSRKESVAGYCPQQ